jgi:hypothetical protein
MQMAEGYWEHHRPSVLEVSATNRVGVLLVLAIAEVEAVVNSADLLVVFVVIVDANDLQCDIGMLLRALQSVFIRSKRKRNRVPSAIILVRRPRIILVAL